LKQKPIVEEPREIYPIPLVIRCSTTVSTEVKFMEYAANNGAPESISVPNSRIIANEHKVSLPYTLICCYLSHYSNLVNLLTTTQKLCTS
jgi:hypothetical protein